MTRSLQMSEVLRVISSSGPAEHAYEIALEDLACVLFRAALLQGDPPPARGPDAAACLAEWPQTGRHPALRSEPHQYLCATPDFA